MTQISPNFDVSEPFKTPNLQSKEAKEVEGSRNIHRIRALADHTQPTRLDNPSRADGLTRQSVYGDGDRFSSAASLYVGVVYVFFVFVLFCFVLFFVLLAHAAV